MKILTIFKNNFFRYASMKTNIIVMLAITVFTVSFVLLFSARLSIKGNIALVARDTGLLQSAPQFNVTLLSGEPPMSELMLGKYDAVVIDRGQNKYEIHSIKNAALTDGIRYVIEHPGAELPNSGKHGAGSVILSYLAFFVLLQGVMYMMLFSDDKESGVFRRIGTTPATAGGYLAAHGLSNLLLVFTPTFAVIAIARLAFGADTGFTLLEFAGFTALLSLLSTTFALFTASVVKRAGNCSVIGSVAVMLTTLLAGSFIDFSGTRPTFDKIIGILPQKSFLTMIRGVEQGRALSAYIPQLAHILLLSAAFFLFAVWFSRKNIRRGVA